MLDSRSTPVLAVRRFLGRVVRRGRAFAAVDGALTLVTAALAVLLAGTAVRPATDLFRYAPVVFAAFGLAALAAAAAVALRVWLRRIPLARAALAVERRHPELKSDLISAFELSRLDEADYARYGISRSLVEAVEQRAAEAVGRLDPAAVVERPQFGPRLWLSGALAALAGLLALVAPGVLADSARALVDPFALVPLDALRLEVSPGHATVLRGTPVTIRVRAVGRLPEQVEVAILPDAPAGGDDRPARLLPARPAGDGLFVVGPFPAERSLRYRAEAEGAASPAYRLAVETPPEVGRIVATYHYPAYLGLADRRVEGGTIEAYRGTEIRLALTANKPVVRGRLEFDDGSAQALAVDPPDGSGTALAGTLVVTGEGGYRVVVTDEAGFETPEPVRYEIRVVPDDPPTAEIAGPAQDLTVDQGDVVRIEWKAADDIELGGVDLVFDAGQGEQRVALARRGQAPPGAAPARLAGRYDWRLGGLRLPPGTRVAYYVEARDTDSISGPKTGVSRVYYLEVRSRAEDHEQLRASQREIADALLHALGDQLEREAAVGADDLATARAKGESLDRRLAGVQEQLDAALASAADDPLSDASQLFDMNLLRSYVGTIREAAREAGVDPSSQPPVTRDLEQLASLADEIGRRGEMQDLVRRGEELMRAQTDLLDRLERQEGNRLDPEVRAELEKALGAIEEQLRKLAEQLAKLPQTLPDEFMNSEAMQSLAMDDLADRLERLRQAIRQGDAEQARALARQLAAQLNQMMAALQGAEGASQQAQAGEQLMQQIARQQSRLAELADEQRKLVRRTEELERRATERLARAQQRDFRAFEQRARRQLDALERAARDAFRQASRQGTLDINTYLHNRELQDALREAREQLDAKRAAGVQQALEQARGLLHDSLLPGGAEAAARLGRLARELSQLGGDLPSHLTPAERAEMQKLAGREQALRESADRLRQELDGLSAMLPMLDPGIGRRLREALPFMDEAAEQLGAPDPRGALPPEREALSRLSRAQQAMQQAQQMLAQRGGLQGMSAPQMMARRPGGMPGGGGGPLLPRTDPREGGRAGVSTRDFELPGRDDYTVPRVYREQVIEALREPVPDRYRHKVEQYFKNLTE